MATVYVDPLRGNNQNSGQSNAPLRTLTYALRRIEAGSRIQLQPGDYNANSGESFPIRIPADVVVTGNATNRGRNVKIYGGGAFRSSEFGSQWATVVLESSCDLQGVTITNPVERGSGVWIESASPTIAYCTLVSCRREGVFILGQSAPLIHHCMIQANAASGVFVARQAKGELRHNQFQNTGYGMAISDQSAPLIIDNRFLDNRSGLVISRSARPVLRDNLIARSQGDGLAVLNSAQPDLGDREEAGRNVFEDSRGFDIRNQTSIPLPTSGNQINPVKVSGLVQYVASIVPPAVERSPGGSNPPPPPNPPSYPPSSPPTSPSTFPDVTRHWARSFIEALADRDFIRGFPDGSFRPEANLTRAEYAALLAKTFSQPNRRLSNGFSDVPSSFWAAPAILRAAQMGFIAGFPDGTFRPQEPLTRLQILLSLVNGLSLQGGSSSELEVYQDRAEIPSYAVGAVAIATQKQLVVNYPNPSLLEPSVPASRAETAAILYQALVVMGEAPPIPSPYVIIPSTASAAFSDISSQWEAPYIQGIASQGYVGGFSDGTFHPDAPVRRAQYAVWLDQTLGLSSALFADSGLTLPDTFTDLPSTHWAFLAFQRLVAGNVLSRTTDGRVQPDASLTRAELLISLASGLAVTMPPEETDPDASAQTHSLANPKQAIANLNQMGMQLPAPLTDLENERDWTKAATRGEVAACLYQVLVYQRRAEAIASPSNSEALGSQSSRKTSVAASSLLSSGDSAQTVVQEPKSASARTATLAKRDTATRSSTSARLEQLTLPAITPKPVVVAIATAIQTKRQDKQQDPPEPEPTQYQLQQCSEAIAKAVAKFLKRQGIETSQLSADTDQSVEDTLTELMETTHPDIAMLIVVQSDADKSETTWQISHGSISKNGSASNFTPTSAPVALAEALHWQLVERTDLQPRDVEVTDPAISKPSTPYPLAKIQFSPSSALLRQQRPIYIETIARRWGEAIAQGLLNYIQRYISP